MGVSWQSPSPSSSSSVLADCVDTVAAVSDVEDEVDSLEDATDGDGDGDGDEDGDGEVLVLLLSLLTGCVNCNAQTENQIRHLLHILVSKTSRRSFSPELQGNGCQDHSSMRLQV